MSEATLSETLNEKQLREILDLAATSPSGDNCQPWEFVWNGKELSVFHNEERGQHALNVENQASLIAFGCLIEIIFLAARQQGFDCRVDYTPSVGSTLPEAWATLTFQKGGSKVDGDLAVLAAGIRQRCADRRDYERGKFPENLLKSLESDNRLAAHAQSYVCNEPGPELIKCLAVSESQIVRWNRGFASILKWVRFSEKDARATRDGMSWMNLGVKFHEAQSMRMIRRFSWILTVLRPGLFMSYSRGIANKIKHSAGLICIAADGTDPASTIEAGRLVMRTWLRLTSVGFAAQPLTFSSLFIQFFRLRDAGRSNPISELGVLDPIVEKGRAIISREFKIPANMTPVWMFRAGKADALPEEKRAFRREPILKILS